MGHFLSLEMLKRWRINKARWLKFNDPPVNDVRGKISMQNNKEDFRFPTFTSGWHAVYTGSEAAGRPMHLVAKVKVNNENDH